MNATKEGYFLDSRTYKPGDLFHEMTNWYTYSIKKFFFSSHFHWITIRRLYEIPDSKPSWARKSLKQRFLDLEDRRKQSIQRLHLFIAGLSVSHLAMDTHCNLLCSTPSLAWRIRPVCFQSWLMQITAIPNIERIYWLNATFQVLKLVIDLNASFKW